MKQLFYFCMIFSAFLFTACKEDNIEPVSVYDYFPIDSGAYIVYECDSIVHLDIDDNSVPLTDTVVAFHYYLMEVIDSSFIDASGNLAYRLNRYRRLNDTLPWSFQNVWVVQKILNSAQRVEDNIRYVKLQFPIDSRRSWNGNAFNIYPAEDYEYDNVHEPKTYGSLSFDSTVTVIQNDFSSIINKIFKQEQYANYVGLVYKQSDSLTLTTFTGQLLPLNGFEYKQTIVDRGHF